MVRPAVLGCGLLVIAAVSAGCGGGYQAAVRQHARQFLGNGNPKILRIETVRDLGGNKEIVARLQGNFKLPPGNGPGCVGRCPSGPPPRYAWLSFGLGQASEMGGEAVTSASQLAAIDNAHRARPTFGIFPDFLDMAIQCAIPKGNSSGTFAGSCSTQFEMPFDHPRSIRFHEAWAFAPTSLGYRRQRADGGWIVSLDRSGHVRSIRRFGDLPPQLWK